MKYKFSFTLYISARLHWNNKKSFEHHYNYRWVILYNKCRMLKNYHTHHVICICYMHKCAYVVKIIEVKNPSNLSVIISCLYILNMQSACTAENHTPPRHTDVHQAQLMYTFNCLRMTSYLSRKMSIIHCRSCQQFVSFPYLALFHICRQFKLPCTSQCISELWELPTSNPVVASNHSQRRSNLPQYVCLYLKFLILRIC